MAARSLRIWHVAPGVELVFSVLRMMAHSHLGAFGLSHEAQLSLLKRMF